MSDDDLFDKPNGTELPKELFGLSVSQLKKVAKHHNVSVVGTRKADIIFMLNEAGITNAEGVDLDEPTAAEKNVKPKKESEENKKEKQPILTGKIAIYSEKNRFNSDFGRIERGYTIVSPAQRDFWLKFPGVREATPKEVAKYYGVK